MNPQYIHSHDKAKSFTARCIIYFILVFILEVALIIGGFSWSIVNPSLHLEAYITYGTGVGILVIPIAVLIGEFIW